MKMLIVTAALCVAAHAQVNGTVIVFELTGDGFFIAADSRAVFENKPPEDTHCKVAAINQNTVFAVSAAAAYPTSPTDPVRSWDAIHEAKLAALTVESFRISTKSKDVATKIADAWAKQIETQWNLVKIFHPDKLREAETRGDGVLTNDIFLLSAAIIPSLWP